MFVELRGPLDYFIAEQFVGVTCGQKNFCPQYYLNMGLMITQGFVKNTFVTYRNFENNTYILQR